MKGSQFGEYDMVTTYSKNRALLEKAHLTAIAPEAVIFLVRRLWEMEIEKGSRWCTKCLALLETEGKLDRQGLLLRCIRCGGPVDDHEYRLPNVSFCSYKGKATRRKIQIDLPRRPLNGDGVWFGRLRVGLVLHELANLMAGVIQRRTATGCPWRDMHGDHFISKLDELLSSWQELAT